jgi:hypothetical protein
MTFHNHEALLADNDCLLSGGKLMHNDSKVAGILSIISGVFGILSMFGIVLFMVMFYYMSRDSRFYYDFPYPSDMMNIVYIMYGVMGIGMALLGVLAIIGGVFALKRKYWGWALAGTIASTITFFPCGAHADFQVDVKQVIVANSPGSTI